MGAAGIPRVEHGLEPSPRERRACPTHVRNVVDECTVPEVMLGRDVGRSVDRRLERMQASDEDSAYGRSREQFTPRTLRRGRRPCPVSVMNAVAEERVARVIQGHDIDLSADLRSARLHAWDSESAAGLRPKPAESRSRRKCPEQVRNAVAETSVTDVVLGHSVDQSERRRMARLDAIDVESAAGRQKDRTPQKEGRRVVAGPASSIETMLGDGELSQQADAVKERRSGRKPGPGRPIQGPMVSFGVYSRSEAVVPYAYAGAAGFSEARRNELGTPREARRRDILGSVADDVILGRDIDSFSSRKPPAFEGAAGQYRPRR